MGVLSKWFKKSESRTSGGDGYSAVAVEAKPIRNEQGSDASPNDQAERLRKAVAQKQQAVPGATQSQQEETDLDLLEDSSAYEALTESSDDSDGADSSQPITRKSKSPRSKQELIEELHRNYQEVLGLIRKLDTHLDQSRDRSESFADVADQYARLAPVIESLPDRLAEESSKLSTDLRAGFAEEGAASRELLGRIESAIVHVGTDIERSTNQQGQLVQTMAEYRESLTDLSHSSRAACESVREAQVSSAERDQALLNQLRQTRLWLIGLTVGVSAIGVAAIVLGFIALKG